MRNIVGQTLGLGALLVLVLSGAGRAAVLENPGDLVVRAAAVGRPATALDGSETAEAVTMRTDLAARLLELHDDASALVTDWPTMVGERGTVRLTRFEVYAHGARIVKIVRGKSVDVPRSRLAFYRGDVVDDEETRLLVSVDPDSGSVAGLATRRGEIQELRATGKPGAGSYLLAPVDSFKIGNEKPTWSCGEETTAADKILLPDSTAHDVVAKAITSLHTAAIAVDTDNELLSLKFGNNTTAATNYIANLFAAMNVIYERDLLIRLLQGFTILRPSTTADPYAQTDSPADGNDLNEFSNYWAGGCGGACAGVARAAAILLSGKSSGDFSASGIAWLTSLCSTSTGYSVNQVFKFAQDTSGNDIMVVAHEIGHNFGSPHTHCYSPPIDTCWNHESCYTGGTACPAPATYQGVPNVTGTLMSYCHLTGCGSSPVFHPRTVTLLQPIIEARVNQCIFPLGPATTIFSSGFEGGSLPAPWASKAP